MKVLLSAYACEPGKGSETAVGWHWALEIACLGHEVWVLTRANNRPTIEAGLAKMKPIPNLHFIYYDLPGWARKGKKLPGGIYPYYLFWQWGAYRLAREIHHRERFGLVHHITFVSLRLTTFMGGLGIPFIFGPAAGGEKAPWRLRAGYGLRGWLMDGLRDLVNLMVRVDPLAHRTFRQAEKIYVTSEQTLELLPARYRNKASVQLAIGLDKTAHPAALRKKHTGFRVLYVGRFLYWKGMHLGLAAFADLVAKAPNARLTMVGKGPDEKRLRRLADALRISGRIEWIPWLPQAELAALYSSHDVFLFPSLHDSGGMVVLEAMAHGLPVICLDLGGPGMMVNDKCGHVIPTAGQSAKEVSSAIAGALTQCAENPEHLKKLGSSAKKRVTDFTWKKQVRRLYSN